VLRPSGNTYTAAEVEGITRRGVRATEIALQERGDGVMLRPQAEVLRAAAEAQIEEVSTAFQRAAAQPEPQPSRGLFCPG